MSLVKPEIYDSLYRDEQFAKYSYLFKLGIEFRGTVLDAGCGTALLYEYIMLNYGNMNARYVCLDPDPSMLRIASSRIKSSLVIVVEAYAEELPLRNGAFDVVVSISTWGALSKTPGALRELKNALRDGGKLVITGHPRTYSMKPIDVDRDFRHVGNYIDDFYVAVKNAE